MTRESRAWLVAAFIAAVVAIAAQLAGVWVLHAAAKPAATIAIWGFARSLASDDVARRRCIEGGLALSLVGDVALMWPQGFLPGLVAFLLAHLAYIVAFTRGGVGFARHKLPFVVYAAIAAAVLSMLWPHIEAALKLPVLAYVVCLACMAAQAAVWWLHARGRDGAGLDPGAGAGAGAGAGQRAAAGASTGAAAGAVASRAAVGGLLFMVSDASLAINKFMQPLLASSLIVLGTYWAAQTFIAWSLAPRR